MGRQRLFCAAFWQSDGWALSWLPKYTARSRVMDENLAVPLEIAGILDALKVRWFLGGSLASSVHGIPRATLDADIAADLRAPLVRPLLQALGEAWYVEEEAVRQAIVDRSSFKLIHFGTAMKIDVFVPKLRQFDGGQFGRAKRTPVTEGSAIEIPVCSAEDIVLAKLEWYRAGGELSERQWGDVIGVLRVNAKLRGCTREQPSLLSVICWRKHLPKLAWPNIQEGNHF